MGSKKLTVGILIGSELNSGGGFQYEYRILDILKKYHSNSDITIKYYGITKQVALGYKKLGIPIKVIKKNVFHKILSRISSHKFFLRISSHKFFNKLGLKSGFIESVFRKEKIDLVYFLANSLKRERMKNIPYIYTVLDFGHLEIMEFPEVSYNGEFERRENLYLDVFKKAVKVIVDSNYTKKYAIKKYNLDEKRIEVLKFLPNIRTINTKKRIDIKEKYNLKNDYIFYPAQFWAHKNHIYILKALKILKEEKNKSIDVLFSGSDNGNLEYILNKAKEYDIEDLVHYIGFVSNEEIPYLYKQSLALVMPTHLGPTNIPPLEAFAYQTPVCYSDKPFFHEQVGDAAFFIDLMNPRSLVENLIIIQNNEPIVSRKIAKGNEVLSLWSDKEFYDKLIAVFNEYKWIRELWA